MANSFYSGAKTKKKYSQQKINKFGKMDTNWNEAVLVGKKSITLMGKQVDRCSVKKLRLKSESQRDFSIAKDRIFLAWSQIKMMWEMPARKSKYTIYFIPSYVTFFSPQNNTQIALSATIFLTFLPHITGIFPPLTPGKESLKVNYIRNIPYEFFSL